MCGIVTSYMAWKGRISGVATLRVISRHTTLRVVCVCELCGDGGADADWSKYRGHFTMCMSR